MKKLIYYYIGWFWRRRSEEWRFIVGAVMRTAEQGDHNALMRTFIVWLRWGYIKNDIGIDGRRRRGPWAFEFVIEGKFWKKNVIFQYQNGFRTGCSIWMSLVNFWAMITFYGANSIWIFVAFHSFYLGARWVRALEFELKFYQFTRFFRNFSSEKMTFCAKIGK